MRNKIVRLVLSEICEFGIEEIDNGHDRIVLMINEIGDCIEHRDFDAALRQVIHLIAVERKHLQSETRLLKKYKYNQITAHDDFHDDLNKILNRMMEALGDEEFESVAALHKELTTGFIEDVLKADLPFKSLIQHEMKNA